MQEMAIPAEHILHVELPPSVTFDVITAKKHSREDIRAAICELQKEVAKWPDKLPDCTLRHHFAPGCYAREMTIPKGILIIGKIHKHSHLNIISKGKVAVMTEFGPMKMEGPCTFVSEIGTKRAVLALEETIWTTIHVTEETDLEKIEEYVIAKDYAELDQYLLETEQKKRLEVQS